MMLLPVMAFVRTHASPWVSEVSRAFTEARMMAQLSQKAIAIDAELTEAHLSQQIQAHGLNLNRLVLVRNQIFWRVFLPLLADIVDCADLLVNPIAVDVAKDVARAARELSVMRAELAEVHRQLKIISAARRVSA